jgi:hypothetical protein
MLVYGVLSGGPASGIQRVPALEWFWLADPKYLADDISGCHYMVDISSGLAMDTHCLYSAALLDHADETA